MINETKGQTKTFRLKHRKQKDKKYWVRVVKDMVFQENIWSHRRRRKKEQFKSHFEGIMVLNFAELKEVSKPQN